MASPLPTHAIAKVGVIGLGQMGRGIAANLDRGGMLHAAFDTDPEAFARAKLSSNAAQMPLSEIGASCDAASGTRAGARRQDHGTSVDPGWAKRRARDSPA